jgi:uncharacterized glyoxalase superfamily protein PhnB
MDNLSLNEQLDRAIQALLAPADRSVRENGFARGEANAVDEVAQLAQIASTIQGLPREEFKFRLKTDLERSATMASSAKASPNPESSSKPANRGGRIPAGYRTVTPYLSVRDVDSLLDLVQNAFGAAITEKRTTPRGIHAEARIGDSMLMMGGPSAPASGLAERHTAYPVAIHLKVDDVDSVYARTLAMGAMSLGAPQDHEYGERGAAVKDSNGNFWYLAQPMAGSHYLPEMGNVTLYLHPRNSNDFIHFIEKAFGAEELMRAGDPGGPVHHAKVRIGDSVVEMSDARAEYPTMPAMIYMYVEDVDAWYNRAIAAGATSNTVPAMLPYGDYVGSVDDPFGNRWYMSAHMQEPAQQPIVARQLPNESSAVSYIRKGFRTLTPYLLVDHAAKEIEFLKSALGAEEIFRVARPGSDAVMHAEIRIGDSIVELADSTAEFPARASVNVLYVPDVDAAYARAMAAGAISLGAPADKPFGDRDAGFTGPGGVTWWISSRGPGNHITPDTPSLVPMFTVHGANDYIEFLKNAFGAEQAFMHKDPNGVLRHARIRIGNSIIGGSEAHGPYQSAPFLIHMYIPNIDDVYARALKAGATSVRNLEDAPYGDRTATVQDPAGNLWSLATHIRDVQF